MIDWLTFTVDFPHQPLETGYLQRVDADGVVEFRTPLRMPVEGSHSSRVSVRSSGTLDDQGRATSLHISGNPSKFLQGHNLFGSDDICSLAHDTLVVVGRAIGLDVDRFTLSAVLQGRFRVSRVDINYSFALPSQADVMNWIRSAEFKSRTRSGRPVSQPGTIYWQASKRWRLKAYSKWNELVNGGKAHRLPTSLGMENIELLLGWAEKILRVEIQLNSTELSTLDLQHGADIAPRIRDLFQRYQGLIVTAENMKLRDKELLDLPAHLRGTYTLWKEGHLVSEVLSKPTFYRHRKALLAHGIDISIACDEDAKTANVVPMIRYLEAVPVGIPEWARAAGLVHHSAVAA